MISPGREGFGGKRIYEWKKLFSYEKRRK